MAVNESPSPSIVVGVDGSRTAIQAALWAVDEAVSRDIPLRLVYAIEPDDTPQNRVERAARKLAIAENAVRYVSMAVEAEEKPVKIEVEIDQEFPTVSLIRASASAAMVCVGAVGLHHFRPERAGSTATALAASAHCPVAIIRGHGGHDAREGQWIVVDAYGSVDNDAVMGSAIQEARLRQLPLRVVVSYRHGSGSGFGAQVGTEDGDHQMLCHLDRRLARWRRRYPDVGIDAVVWHGTLLDYLSEHRRTVRLVVVGIRNREQLEQLVGPSGNAVLQKADCSALVVDRQHL